MYRVKVQAISGAKIFADGKWLKCIGNKTFHVGELVYTDGRCVYGHNTIPQQPFVITAIDDEIIPIVTTEGYYIFFKGKLKRVAFNDSDKLPDTDDKIFVHNKKAKAFFISGYQFLPGQYVYSYTNNWRGNAESETYCELKCLLAGNLDKSGNLYTISVDGFMLKVSKNGENVEEINLENLVREVNNKVSQPSSLPIEGGEYRPPGEPDSITIYTQSADIFMTIDHCFIENENDWSVFITFGCDKETRTIRGDFDRINDIVFYTHYSLINGKITSDEGVTDTYSSPDPSTQSPETGLITLVIAEPNPNIKIPLQDGYYFTEKFAVEIFGSNTVAGQEVSSFTYYMERSIYSPNNKKVFTGLFSHESNMIFSKVRDGYLMAVNSYYGSNKNGNLQTKLNLPYFFNGIFLLRSGGWEILTEEFSNEKYLNQRLTPMKKNKNWVQRIQEINFE